MTEAVVSVEGSTTGTTFGFIIGAVVMVGVINLDQILTKAAASLTTMDHKQVQIREPPLT